MFEPFGQSLPLSKAVSSGASRDPGTRLARVGIWLFWLLVAAVVIARVALLVSGNLFAFAS